LTSRYRDRLASDSQDHVGSEAARSMRRVLGHLELLCLNAESPEQALVFNTEG